MKKWGFRILGLIVIAVLGLILYIELNKDELIAAGIEEANKSINGVISYESTDVSFLSSFPDLKITLNGLKIISSSHKEDQELLTASDFSIDIGLMSVFQRSKPIELNAIYIDQAQMYLIQGPGESSNYDLFPESESTSEANIDFNINDFRITKSKITFVDLNSGTKGDLDEINIKGRINYIAGSTTITSNTESAVRLEYNRLLPSYNFDLKAQSLIHLNAAYDSIEINKLDVQINDLPISIKGNAYLGAEIFSYALDLSSPTTEIKKLISLLPGYYKNEYQNLVSRGTYSFNANINGSSDKTYPLYSLQLISKDGAVTHPSLPVGIDNISFDMVAENHNYNSPYSNVNINKVNVQAGQNFIKGQFQLKKEKEIANAFIDISTYVSLSEMSKVIFLQNTSQLEGSIDGKILASAQLDKSNTIQMNDRQKFDADITISNLAYKDPQTMLAIPSGHIASDNNQLIYRLDDFNYNNALDGNIEGIILRPIDIVIDPDAIVRGTANIKAGTIDLNQLTTVDTGVVVPTKIPAIDFTFQFTADKIIQSSYVLNDVQAAGDLRDKDARISFSIGEINGSAMQGNALLDHVLSYGINNDTLSGQVQLRSDILQLDPWMIDSEVDPNLAINDELIPGNVQLDIDYTTNHIKFKNIEILESLGQINISEKKVTFKNDGGIFGGRISLGGIFDASKKDGYHLDLDLGLKNLGFQETAKKTKIFSDLIPVAKLLQGNYTATLKWSSDLSKDYLPELNTISAYGEIETKDGSIIGKLPIDSILRKFVNVGEEKVIQIADSKKYFIVENGKVMVQNLQLQKGDVVLSFSGAHSFNQDIDYQVLIDIPKSKINVNQVVDFIQDKLNFSEKLKAKTGDVQVQIVGYLGGNLRKPKFSVQKVNLKSGSVVESIGDQAKLTLDGIRNSLTDTVQYIKDSLRNLADKKTQEILSRADSLKTDVTGKIDSTVNKLKETANKEKGELAKDGGVLLDDLKTGNVDSLKHEINDIFGKNKGKLDSLKIKLPTNIFNKKKKSGENE